MARFTLRPLFKRSKTASSAESERDSTTTTAVTSSTSHLSSPRPQKSASSLKRLRDNNTFSPPALPDNTTGLIPPDTRERSFGSTTTATASSTHSPSAADISRPAGKSTSLETSNNEKASETADHAIHPLKLPNPSLLVHHPTPPTTNDPRQITAIPPSALSGDQHVFPPSPQQQQQRRPSSTASPKHLPSRAHSIDDSTDASVTYPPKMPRKIWVRRPGASATLVQIRDDDLVDDVREMILKKYANSLGRTFDAPDMTLRIVARPDHAAASRSTSERVLGPEEDICRAVDTAYPGGQTVEEALIIDVPTKRTPRPSPRAYHHHQTTNYHALDEYRPVESGTDYFPPMPAIVQPVMPATATGHETRTTHHSSSLAPSIPEHQRSISVLSTGQLPPLPSPGANSRRHRPKYNRQHTSSPTIIQHNTTTGALAVNPPNLNPNQAHIAHRLSTRPRVDSSASESHQHNAIPPAPALPTPPAPEAPPTAKGAGSNPPTPSTASANLHLSRPPRPRKFRKSTPEKVMNRARRERQGSTDSPAIVPPINNMLDGSVPPINVLIVEDNHINLRVLEGLMKRLRVRWATAMNGKIAVDKWRGGGFHLILMDIQMPVMNGLQATKEIRRLEKVNGIGVFSSSAPSSPEQSIHAATADSTSNGLSKDGYKNANTPEDRNPDDDRLPLSEGLFKSPIIIVALTASSLQSDRHEALAAGCNDFLTKPVHIPWLERKVKEWGCMQALIDFDGWRRWREFIEKEEAGKTEEEKRKEKEQEEKQKRRSKVLEKMSGAQQEKEKKPTNRASVDASLPNGKHVDTSTTNGG